MGHQAKCPPEMGTSRIIEVFFSSTFPFILKLYGVPSSCPSRRCICTCYIKVKKMDSLICSLRQNKLVRQKNALKYKKKFDKGSSGGKSSNISSEGWEFKFNLNYTVICSISDA